MSLPKRSAALFAAALSILPASVLAAGNEPAVTMDKILEGQLKVLSDLLSPALQQSLAESQQRWIAYRDQQCAYQLKLVQEYGRGKMQLVPGQGADCIVALNQQRLRDLQTQLSILMAIQGRAQQTGDNGNLPQECRLTGLPDKFEVHAVGTYSGITQADVKFGDSRSSVGDAQVIVNKPGGLPVVLVLSAFGPTVWRVSRTPETQIVAVVVGGYHPQALLGIERATPKLFAIFEGTGLCGFFLAYDANQSLTQANARIKAITGREIDRLVTKPTDGRFVVGTESGIDPTKLVSSDEVKIEDYPGATAALAGQKGLDALVAQGKLRRATQADIDAWIERASARYRKLDPTLTVKPFILLERTYVVLAPLDLPPGLSGAQSSLFIVPQNVRPPNGAFGSWVFLMSTGACLMHGTMACPE